VEPLKRFHSVTDVRVHVNRAANCAQFWLIPAGPLLLKLRKRVVYNVTVNASQLLTNVYSSTTAVMQELQNFSPPAAGFTCSYFRANDATRHRCHSTTTAANLLDSASPALMAKTRVYLATTLYTHTYICVLVSHTRWFAIPLVVLKGLNNYSFYVFVK
jgi:hypothetical protein